MELEIRTKNGICIADFKGKVALKYFEHFSDSKDFEKKVRSVKGKGDIHVFEATNDMKIIPYINVVIWIFKGSYIKIKL